MINIPSPLSRDGVLPWEGGIDIERPATALPTLSVVVPVLNAGGFIERTIRSLMHNDLRGVEIILQDGGSTDATMRIADHYRDVFTHISSGKDRGQSDAINKGMAKSTGAILYWLNGDDILLPNALTKVRTYFLKHSDCDVVVGNGYMTESDFTPISHFVYSEASLDFHHLLDYAANHLIQPTVFFRREAWLRAGPLDEDDHYAMDADLFLGMAKYCNMKHMDEDLAYSVYHEHCKTRSARAESISALALVQAKYGGAAEARRTMGILISKYRALEGKGASGKPGDGAPAENTSIWRTKFQQMEEVVRRQQELMLSLDIGLKE